MLKQHDLYILQKRDANIDNFSRNGNYYIILNNASLFITLQTGRNTSQGAKHSWPTDTMNIITDIDNHTATPCVATIGSFDGVHKGHLALLEELRAKARENALPMTVITFAKHPRTLINKEREPFLLSSNSEKTALLEEAGVDNLIQLNFDCSLAAMSAKEFMQTILAGKLNVKVLAVGYDHHFGRPVQGEGIADYVTYGKDLGIEVFQASQFVIDNEKVSSSAVRRALTAGNMKQVQNILGRAYSFNGTVVTGAGIGRKLGFPTANIELEESMKMLPADGVYEVAITMTGAHYKGVMNIGIKPTIAKNLKRTTEVHILDFNGDIYGENARIEILRRLRGEMSFENLDALKAQIEADITRVKTGK